jgi:photosystem II stability/assembly factor-like uncharacterized protein
MAMMRKTGSKKTEKSLMRNFLIPIALGIMLLFIITTVTESALAQVPVERHWTKLTANRIALWGFPPTYAQDGWMYLATAATEKLSARGIYSSKDRGDSWVNVAGGALDPKKVDYYTVITFSPQFETDKTIYLFGHKTSLAVGEAVGGFWVSTDGGTTWKEIDYKGFPYREMTRRVSQSIIGLVISPNIATDGIMVAATGGEGVYQSKDKGLNWELLNPVLDVTNIFAPPSFPDEPFLALATTGSQVMISTDGGKNFATSAAGLPDSMKTVKGVAFSGNFAKDRKMFCYGAGGVFVSDDAAKTWKPLALPEENVSIMSMAVTGDFVSLGSIAYSTDDSKLYLSDDMGKTFKSTASESLMNYNVDALAFTPDYATSGELYTGSQDGIFRYGPARSEGAAEAAHAASTAVEATRSFRATEASGLVFVPEKSNRVETGCLAYTTLPAGIILVVALKKRGRKDGK